MKLILLSLDGLRPEIYRAPAARHRFPNLAALEQAGASAEAVESIYPSTTYPAHATLVTGRDLLLFLKEWWCNHIQEQDMKYMPYLIAAVEV